MSQNGACYIRVSTEEQTEYSPDAQLRIIRDYAKKNDIQLSDEHIYIDAGISGRKAAKRPAFMKMIATAKTKPKPFDIILVHKFDRFARSREDSIVYKSLLKKEAGIKVISITESIEDDKFSVILEAMLEAMAEYYSINLAEEVKKGMTEKARTGGYQTSPPLGYIMNGNHLTVENEEAQYIRYIFDQYVRHDQSPFQIARKLNEMSITSKRGNKIDLRGIQYILQNPVYIGMVRWTPTERARRNFDHPDSIVVKGEHDPIITEELFNEAKEKLQASAKHRKPRGRSATECKHWLSGLIRCSACGSGLAMASSLKYPSFQCSAYSKGQCPVSHGITVKAIETAVIMELDSIFELGDKVDFIPNVNEHVNNEVEKNILKNQLTRIKSKLERVNEAYLAELYTLEEYKEQKLRLEGQRERLEADINSINNIQPAIATNPPEKSIGKMTDLLHTDMDMKAKQRAVRSIVQRIVYNKVAESIEIYFHDM